MAAIAMWKAANKSRIIRPFVNGLKTQSNAPRTCQRYVATNAWISEQGVSRWATPPDYSPEKYRGNIFTTRHEFFADRHIGPDDADTDAMLKKLDPPVKDLEDFVSQTLPSNIRSQEVLPLVSKTNPSPRPSSANNSSKPQPTTPLSIWGKDEMRMQTELRRVADLNKPLNCFIGRGYYGTIVPEVIKRNVLENPAWYTSYTPYQAEISQGRLESLLNFQTMVTDLTGLTIANASVLDEATAAAEAMTMSMNSLSMSRQKRPNKKFVVSNTCHDQTIAVLESRANGFGIEVVIGDIFANDSKLIKDQGDNLIGVLAQYPDTYGGVHDLQHIADATHEHGALLSVATDLLALTVLKPPGEFGADIAFGSTQRLGVPMGFGGPHAAFFACGEKHKRKIPGRLVGVSKDRLGNHAMRLAMQTREQHIRREKATSNICTAQALLANMSAMYAVYHGPDGLKRIANTIREKARVVQELLMCKGFKIETQGVRDDGAVLFDTIIFTGKLDKIVEVHKAASAAKVALRTFVGDKSSGIGKLGVSVDETSNFASLLELVSCLGVTRAEFEAALGDEGKHIKLRDSGVPSTLQRSSSYLTHPVFNQHHSETELLRYIHHLESKDLSLVHSMIPLGSCTMKLNASTEMVPVTMAGFANIHPFQHFNSTSGYQSLIHTLSTNLITITGMDAISLQPNSGAQGEFAGLRVIKKYFENQPGGKQRTVCLIPVSAHGTNPASAAMAGMKVVPLKCDTQTGNLDLKDLQEKCEKHKDELAAIMVTYPSTFGVFEPEIKKVCEIVHEYGGQVYMDGANMNAQIGLCSPGEIGADVCHLNLHKTFCIPHGGGGPGIGPIAVKKHLEVHLPGHPFNDPQLPPPIGQLTGEQQQLRAERASKSISPVSAAPFGSASILPISHAYIQMMGALGLVHQTKIALLNANYIMSRLKPHYPILYTNANGRCAHEFILDIRGFKETAGIEAIDVAKRLQDFGFHAPTMSWPVANTLMIEPTESESKAELDRFCEALITIRKEIKQIEDGNVPRESNVLKMAPHPQQDLLRSDWDRPYSREQAAYPLPWLKEKKFWPSVARVDDAYGDTNLFCTCPPMEAYGGEDITGLQAPMPT